MFNPYLAAVQIFRAENSVLSFHNLAMDEPLKRIFLNYLHLNKQKRTIFNLTVITDVSIGGCSKIKSCLFLDEFPKHDSPSL